MDRLAIRVAHLNGCVPVGCLKHAISIRAQYQRDDLQVSRLIIQNQNRLHGTDPFRERTDLGDSLGNELRRSSELGWTIQLPLRNFNLSSSLAKMISYVCFPGSCRLWCSSASSLF